MKNQIRFKRVLTLLSFFVFCCLSSSIRPAHAALLGSTSTKTHIAQGDARLARLESLMLNYVNEARHKAGLGAVTADSTLAEVARAHSAEMRDKGYFAHESPTPELREPLDRYLAVFRTPPHLLAENIFRSWGSRHQISDGDALRAHNALMNSPGHRANILRAGVTRIGIGIVANENGDLWVTQNFTKP